MSGMGLMLLVYLCTIIDEKGGTRLKKRYSIYAWFLLLVVGLWVLSVPGFAQGSEPVYGGTFSMAISDDPPLWPIKGGVFNLMPNKLIYEPLVKYDAVDLSLVGGLAESWEVSSDGLVWTFHLRDGVKWHDGAPFTADDVKFSFDTWMNPNIPYYLSGNVAGLSGVEVVDRLTVKVHAKQPLASFPALLAYNMNILPKHLLEGYSDEELANPTEFLRNPIGTGPFKFDRKQAGSYVRVVANEEYWGGRPYLDAVVFKVIPDIDTQLAQLQAGDLDFVVIEPYQMAPLQGVKGLRVDEAPQVNHFYIDLNHYNPIFQDKSVRQALTYALDRQAIIDNILMGTAKLATGPISPLLKWAYEPNVKQYPCDPAKAKQLLDAAGWLPGSDGVRQKDGHRLSFTIEVDPHPVRQQIALVAQQAWQAVGCEVFLELYEYSVIVSHSRTANPVFDANPNWLVTPADPDISTYYLTDSGGNTSKWSNPEVDELLMRGKATLDQGERTKIYSEIQEIIAEEAPIIYLYYPQEIRVFNDKVQGFAPVGYRDAMVWAQNIWKRK